MGQDLRDLLRQDHGISNQDLSEGHEERFLEKLDACFPVEKRRNSKNWFNIAASIVILISVSLSVGDFETTRSVDGSNNEINDKIKLLTNNATIVLPKENSKLAEISPNYKKAENYFLTSIHNELSGIQVTNDNRVLVESFMQRLDNLNNEYKQLNNELIVLGPNDHNIEAMMENLSMRLSLLKRLKGKIKELDKVEYEDGYDIQI